MEQYVLTPLENMQDIADKIREVSGLQNKFSPDKCSELVPGLIEGDHTGVCEVAYENGKQAELDGFWEEYQDKGNKYWYPYLFAGTGWNEKTFQPKYDLKPQGSSNGMFQYFEGNKNFDLVNHLQNLGIILDFSQSTNMNYCFFNSTINRVGIINCTKAGNLSNLFAHSYIETIDKWIVCENNAFIFCFTGCESLKNIIIEGTIANNGLDLVDCVNLTHDSIMSFINALKDFSGTTTTKSITFGATNLAKLTDEEKLLATQKGWTLA